MTNTIIDVDMVTWVVAVMQIPTAEELTAMVAPVSTAAPTPIVASLAPSTTPTPSLPPGNPPEPRFSYGSLNTANITHISQLVTINSQVSRCGSKTGLRDGCGYKVTLLICMRGKRVR